MFSTKSAQSLKNLFAAYHEPPSLSHQQSQKLLDGLKSSFRNQLDREYGKSSSSLPTLASQMGKPDRAARVPAAKQHLKAILSNPMFAYNSQAEAHTITPGAVLMEDPMEFFDRAVERGMMTLKAATGCLKVKMDQLQQSPSASAADYKETADRVLNWLMSSSEADGELQFLYDQAFLQALLPFLVKAGSEEVVWEWIAYGLDEREGMRKGGMRRKEMHASARLPSLLAMLVKLQCQPQQESLDVPISTLQTAEKLFGRHPLLPGLLVTPWRYVSWMSTVEAGIKSPATSELFDAHLDTANRLATPLPVETAHLHLHHPSHPDPDPALQFFQARDWMTKDLRRRFEKGGSFGIEHWIKFLGVDTVDQLLQTGRDDEAQGLKELLRFVLRDTRSFEQLHAS